MTCHNCKKDFGEIAGYTVIHLDCAWHFCGRLCMTEWSGPELKKAVVPRQWIPTVEDEERMRQ